MRRTFWLPDRSTATNIWECILRDAEQRELYVPFAVI